DRRLAAHQAGQPNAPEPAAAGRSAGHGFLSAGSSMSARGKPSPESRDPHRSAEERERAELARTWHEEEGFLGRLVSVDHKTIGIRYIVTAFAFFALGGLEALCMRLQLAVPENRLLNPDVYDQIFTMHGTTMMFFFAV